MFRVVLQYLCYIIDKNIEGIRLFHPGRKAAFPRVFPIVGCCGRAQIHFILHFALFLILCSFVVHLEYTPVQMASWTWILKNEIKFILWSLSSMIQCWLAKGMEFPTNLSLSILCLGFLKLISLQVIIKPYYQIIARNWVWQKKSKHTLGKS